MVEACARRMQSHVPPSHANEVQSLACPAKEDVELRREGAVLLRPHAFDRAGPIAAQTLRSSRSLE